MADHKSASAVAIVQLTGGTAHLAGRLNVLLATSDLKRFRVAVSYVRWSGLGLLASRIESFLRAGGDFQTIYGVENGVTTPDSLLYSLYLQKIYASHSFAGVIKDKYENATFHPKFFEFKFSKRTVVIIGSNNLTAGGLANNTEIALQFRFSNNDPMRKQLDEAWDDFECLAENVSIKVIRQLKEQRKLGSEQDREPGAHGPKAKPFIKSSLKTAKKPLFLKILDIKSKKLKTALISNLDVISDRPKRLYLQILKYETGGSKADGSAGYQVQLPVATLSAFFGVAPDETRKVRIHFGTDIIEVSLTHFDNNTHRIRLRPIRNIKRPAIVIFKRLSGDDYDCSIVGPGQYRATLAAKCIQQTRAGARKWGIA